VGFGLRNGRLNERQREFRRKTISQYVCTQNDCSHHERNSFKAVKGTVN